MNIPRMLGAVALGFASAVAAGQGFPARPVTIVVPYPPGGAVDPFARLFGNKLGEAWKVPVVIQNRPGAGGSIGIHSVARSEPDGYTVVVVSSSMSSFPALYEALPFDIAKDFTYLGIGASVPLGMSANPSRPFNSVPELVAYAKAHPGQLTYSSAGNGTMTSLGAELFKSMAGIDIRHIPYKGSGAAVMAAVGGETDLVYDSVFMQGPQVAAGRLKMLTTGGERRTESAPAAPTFAETYPGYKVISWLGFAGPANMPAEVAARWAREITRIARLPDVDGQMRTGGLEPLTATPDEMRAMVQSDRVKWTQVIEKARIPKVQ